MLPGDVAVHECAADTNASLHRVMTKVIAATQRGRGPDGVAVPVVENTHLRFFSGSPELVAEFLGGLSDLAGADSTISGFPVSVKQGVLSALPSGSAIVPGPNAGALKAAGKI